MNKRVLLVIEDNELNRQILMEILKDEYEVITAGNGLEGIEVLEDKAHEISAVLLDIQMPVMNGYEFLELVNQNPEYKKIPIIVTTVLDSLDDEKRCLELGAVDFVVKPYNPVIVKLRVKNTISLRESNGIISDLEIDALTGFKTRKAYYNEINEIEQDTIQNQQSVGVVFADINGLKRVNDTLGHKAGDKLISNVAKTISEVFPDAKKYRIGGDEFVILAFGESEEDFTAKMKELSGKWKSDCSAAMGGMWLENARQLEKNVNAADKIMYADKSRYYQRVMWEKSEDSFVGKNDFLKSMFLDYVSLYSIDLNTGHYEILRMGGNTNARHVLDNNSCTLETFDDFSRTYADMFIADEDRQEFLDWHSCSNMKKRLMKSERITFHYRSISKDGTNRYFEGYVVKGAVDDKGFQVFLGYRSVDSILYKEKAIQGKLQKALEDAKLQNEIISSIARTYQYISRMDLQADWYEEISNRDETNLNLGKSGHIAEDNERICRERIAPECQEAFLKFADPVTLPDRMQNEETLAMEYQMKDGNWHKLRFIEKKRDASGRLTHVICVIRSISDEKRREHRLEYEAVAAKKETALKSRFLSNMSHDIKTPMNGIIGMIELANRYPDDLEMQRKCHEKILESSRFLVSLVNDILDMNKLESEDAQNREIAFDLTEVLRKANTSKQRKAIDKNIQYIVDWGKAEMKHVRLVGNPIFLERLLSVVSDNAVKFTNPGGIIHVWCIEKEMDDAHSIYEFGCSDSGIGMSEEFLEHAFDVFSQENQTSRSTYEGTGLGLAIGKKLIERMNGTIEIKSQKNVGTTVIMTVPFKLDMDSKEYSEGKNSPSSFAEDNFKLTDMKPSDISVEGMRVLLAEDNELNMEIARLHLERHGMKVECVTDGLEAVTRFQHSEPNYYDVILMDIMMPNMSGWDAARSIRSMKRLDAEYIPIIAMSANTFSDDIINSRISGMDEHLSKPIDEVKLIDAIGSCLRRKRRL